VFNIILNKLFGGLTDTDPTRRKNAIDATLGGVVVGSGLAVIYVAALGGVGGGLLALGTGLVAIAAGYWLAGK